MGMSVVVMVLAFVGIIVSIRHMRDLKTGSIVRLATLLIGAVVFAWASS